MSVDASEARWPHSLTDSPDGFWIARDCEVLAKVHDIIHNALGYYTYGVMGGLSMGV